MHTIEKIGGTSMSRFGEVMENVIIADREGADLYNRVFVVSAYGGITNLLLENKKTAEPGVYAKFAAGDPGWADALEAVRAEMLVFNQSFEGIGLDQGQANEFVNQRIDGIRGCLTDLIRIRSYGHFKPEDYMPATRELLSAVGEVHSAFNSVLILQANGVNARLIDLTGWMDNDIHGFEDMVRRGFDGVDFGSEMPIVTGYTKYDEGIMTRYDRGYSEITFSKIAVVTGAAEGVIHKEFHLSTGDPKLIGEDNVKTIGNTNFDIADQLSDMDMEAIHSKAAKEMEYKNIPIRVKNAFDPEHPGTLISKDYVSPEPRVEMICGRSDVVAVEVVDPDMVGQCGYDRKLLEALERTGISYIAKNTNANTICHIISEKKSQRLGECVELMAEMLPGATVSTYPVAIISAIGSNMKFPGFLARAARALADAGINILAFDQCVRQVNMQFIVERDDFDRAQIILHRELVEKGFERLSK